MAIAYVQDTGKIVADNVSTSAASFAGTPSVNSHIFAQVSSFRIGDSSVAVSDNQTNSYAVDVSQSDGAAQTASIASAKAATSGGTFTVTITPAGSGAYLSWAATEFSGITAASWKDQTGINSGTTGANAAAVTASGANSQANELVVAVMSIEDAGSGDIHIATPTAAYTSRFNEGNGSAHAAGQGSDKIVSAGETSSAAWNHDSAVVWSAVIATYKAAASDILHPGGCCNEK